MSEEEQIQYAISLSKKDTCPTLRNHPALHFLDGHLDGDDDEENQSSKSENKDQQAQTFYSTFFPNKLTNVCFKLSGKF